MASDSISPKTLSDASVTQGHAFHRTDSNESKDPAIHVLDG